MNLIQEQSDGQSLSYILDDSIMISETGLKVLKSQEKVGFLHPYALKFNGKAKLVYLLKEYTSLSSLLDTLRPEMFLTYLTNLFQIIEEVKNIGFMQYSNIQTRLDRIYIDQNTAKVWLIYLPLEQSGIAMDFSTFTAALFANIAAGISQTPTLQTPEINQLMILMQSPNGSFAAVKDILARAVSTNTTGSLQASGATVTESNLTTDFGQNPNMYMPPSAEMPMQNAAPQQSAPYQQQSVPNQQQQAAPYQQQSAEKKGIFSKLFSKEGKKEEKSSYVVQDEGGATEVLGEIFVPTIVLVGVRTPEKISILISKAEFVIGKKEELVDAAILFNPAISRQHAKIISSNGKVYIEDLGSANGTFLNEARLSPNTKTELNVGDKLKFANTNFVVKPV